MSEPKIIVISNDLEIGGIQRSLVEFLNYLVASGCAVTLVLFQTDGELTQEVSKNVNIISRPYRKVVLACDKGYGTKLKLLLSTLKYFFYKAVLRRPWYYISKIPSTYDVAIAYSENGFPLFFTIDKIKAKRRYMWFHHGSYQQNRYHPLFKKYINSFDGLVTVTYANKQMLTSYFPHLESRIHVVSNLINAAAIRQKAVSFAEDIREVKNCISITTVARFAKEKGIEFAIEIANELNKAGVQFKWFFVGDGDTFGKVRDLIISKGLQNSCILLGDKVNPYPYILRADYYVQPSFVESQSISVLEALILQKIVIATDLPALRETLQNGKLGFLCSPRPKNFANQLLSLISGEETASDVIAAISAIKDPNIKSYITINKLLFE